MPEAKTRNFINKEIPTQVFSSELCEIFKKTFLTEQLRPTAFTIFNFPSLYNKNVVLTVIVKRDGKLFHVKVYTK